MESTQLLKCTVEGCSLLRTDQDPRASNRHCAVHRSEAQRKYNEAKLEQEHGKGFNKGVAAYRAVLVREFMQLGSAMLTGDETAYLVQNAPGPLPREAYDPDEVIIVPDPDAKKPAKNGSDPAKG